MQLFLAVSKFALVAIQAVRPVLAELCLEISALPTLLGADAAVIPAAITPTATTLPDAAPAVALMPRACPPILPPCATQIHLIQALRDVVHVKLFGDDAVCMLVLRLELQGLYHLFFILRIQLDLSLAPAPQIILDVVRT